MACAVKCDRAVYKLLIFQFFIFFFFFIQKDFKLLHFLIQVIWKQYIFLCVTPSMLKCILPCWYVHFFHSELESIIGVLVNERQNSYNFLPRNAQCTLFLLYSL